MLDSIRKKDILTVFRRILLFEKIAETGLFTGLKAVMFRLKTGSLDFSCCIPDELNDEQAAETCKSRIKS